MSSVVSGWRMRFFARKACKEECAKWMNVACFLQWSGRARSKRLCWKVRKPYYLPHLHVEEGKFTAPPKQLGTVINRARNGAGLKWVRSFSTTVIVASARYSWPGPRPSPWLLNSRKGRKQRVAPSSLNHPINSEMMLGQQAIIIHYRWGVSQWYNRY